MIFRRALPVPNLCLVTGAANGIGAALSRTMVSLGATVIAIDRDEIALDQLGKEFGEKLLPIVCDLADEQQLAQLQETIASLVAKHGHINLAVMNAAISATGNFEAVALQRHLDVIGVNTVVPLILSSFLVREELMARGSTVIFMSSLSYNTGYPGAATYGASKDAIAIYAKSIRRHFAKRKVHVMSVFPGPTDTAMAEENAPPDAVRSRRKAPDALAHEIIRAAHRADTNYYPGLFVKLVAAGGTIFPRTMTAIMRRVIFEKLPKP